MGVAELSERPDGNDVDEPTPVPILAVVVAVMLLALVPPAIAVLGALDLIR